MITMVIDFHLQDKFMRDAILCTMLCAMLYTLY